MTRATSLLILAAFLLITTACSTVLPGERGLMFRSSGLDKEPLKEGSYWKAPWNEIYFYNVRWQTYAEKVDAWSADDVQVDIKAAIVLRPIPEEVYYLALSVGRQYYSQIVQPEFVAAVRQVVATYPALMVGEKSAEISQKAQTVVQERLKDRHLAIQSVTIADVDLPKLVLTALEQTQAQKQQKEQKEFELLLAGKDAEIARARAESQAKVQETINRTLTPEYLRYKLYDSQTSKMVVLPDNLKLPLVINPGEQQSAQPQSLSGK
ncbi:MAG: prohibitin family protein [Nitrospira sp.]|nr:prohibitin family protein [Nitrospira sp.]